MFTIQTERGRFKVEFLHRRNDIDGNGKPRESWSAKNLTECRGVTTCTIYRYGNHPDGPWLELADAHAVCHCNDNWNYATGRKVALARALGKAFPKWRFVDKESIFPEMIDDAVGMRRLFWDCYHVMSRRPEIVDPGYLLAPGERLESAVGALVGGGTQPPVKVGHVLHQVVDRMRRKELEFTVSASQAATPEPPLSAPSPSDTGASS